VYIGVCGIAQKSLAKNVQHFRIKGLKESLDYGATALREYKKSFDSSFLYSSPSIQLIMIDEFAWVAIKSHCASSIRCLL